MQAQSKGQALDVNDAYFANVDESTHQVLVAERVDGLLRLLPCSIFHNTMMIVSACSAVQGLTAAGDRDGSYPHPYITRGQKSHPSIQHSFNNQEKRKDQKTSHSYV
jgi:hypothetical protein